jgi:hypothetical protein
MEAENSTPVEMKHDPRQKIQADTSEIRQMITINRPTITRTTIATYVSVLKSLFYSAHPSSVPIDTKWFHNQQAVLDAVNDLPVRSRKTTLSAVLVINNGRFNDKVLAKVAEDRETVNEMDKSNEKSQAQEDNWIDYDEVKQRWNELFTRVKHLLNSKSTITKRHDLNELSDFMLLTLCGGLFFPPRRSEWAVVKIKDFDPEKDNYVDTKNGTIVLNLYKTCKTYGAEKILYPKEFKAILKKYLAVLPETQDHLIFDTKDKPMNNVKIAHRLNIIFGKRISTSMLRHIYASKRADMLPILRELESDAAAMGHSLQQHIDYIKV